MHLLFQDPESLDHLRQHPEKLTGAIQEFLRYDPPVQNSTFRHAICDFQVNGVQIEKGQLVTAVLASANRDTRVFPHADQLDIERNPNPHLSFGRGAHFCLGSLLAQLEAQSALEILLSLNVKAGAQPPVRRKDPAFRGFQTFPIERGNRHA